LNHYKLQGGGKFIIPILLYSPIAHVVE